jgi:hypothetical protein
VEAEAFRNHHQPQTLQAYVTTILKLTVDTLHRG